MVAVADVDRDRARQVAGEFGVPHHYGDYRELLARHRLDIVSLALPQYGPGALREWRDHEPGEQLVDASRRPQQRLRVARRSGGGSLRPLRIELEDGGYIVDVTPALPADESVADRCGNIIHDLCQSVLEDRLPLVRFEQMLDVQRLMNGLYDAAEQGREVEMAF